MSESAVLRNYRRVEEALIVCAALQYAEFDASIDNYNHATVNWLLVPALGGIPVRLPASQLEDAKAYLREMVETAEDRLVEATGEAPDPVRRKYWRAWAVAALFMLDWLSLFVLWRFLRATYLKLRHPSPHKLESSSSS
ncbi:hypothetical protein [Hyphomonas sp. UBA4494]|jgi:hypothetical protein|uniref:hypothetical protein n=1 Tax=Hyphomonas sp. UBA4494 TaxID=1946631 RepID=UPI0025C4F567|nr:hypothetical protein [Hyphomonas sp. UBA4494]